jgi:hypothetical protein
MNITRTVLFKSFVKPFYRQHAGFFVFLFVILFGAVGVVDGAGIFEYHYSLIRGLLNNPLFFLLVLFLWLLYAIKIQQFVVAAIKKPEYSFLQALLLLDRSPLFWNMFRVQFLLFLPITCYAGLICSAAVYLHAYISGLFIFIFVLTLCLTSAYWNLSVLENPGQNNRMTITSSFFKVRRTPYWTIFFRYVLRDKMLLFTGIKIYNCVILYLMISNLAETSQDMNMIFLFFSMGIFGHGILIHQLREFEETRLNFYRTVPVPLIKRFLQYALLYFILLIPEFITLTLLIPHFMSWFDGLLVAFFSYGVLLFLNSLLFIRFFKMKNYLKIILGIFLVVYLCILTKSLPPLCLFLLISAMLIFFKRYYRFSREGRIRF